MLPLSANVKVLELRRKERNHMLRLLRSTLRTNFLSVKLWGKKEIHSSIMVAAQTAKVIAIVCAKCLNIGTAHFLCFTSLLYVADTEFSSTSRQDLYQQKEYNSLKAQMLVSIFYP